MKFEDSWIYHITGIENLASIAQGGALLSDLQIGQTPHRVIGYSHIKLRRMTVYRVPCCKENPFVGDFVPFYFCPRSPMLYTINRGNTGLEAGCQKDIVHLATKVESVALAGVEWAISDGNAGADHTVFSSDPASIDKLDWAAIRSNNWTGKTHQKCAEFLVRDRVPWAAIRGIGCMDYDAVNRVRDTLEGITEHIPQIKTMRNWYY